MTSLSLQHVDLRFERIHLPRLEFNKLYYTISFFDLSLHVRAAISDAGVGRRGV